MNQLEEMRVVLQDAGSRVRFGAWAGRDDGRCVVVGFMRLPLQSNLERAEIAVHVLPKERRRGLGRAMAARLESEARDLGRSVLGADVQWPPEGGSAGVGCAGPEFARDVGFDEEGSVVAYTDLATTVHEPRSGLPVGTSSTASTAATASVRRSRPPTSGCFNMSGQTSSV